ncbi:MAG TPA: hypothetical protein VM759_11015, partial [Longimicrobium sp.]|nr:hypothetical protein [Longimicrobium sp.]
MSGLHFLAWYREGLAAAGGLGPDPEDASLPARRAVPFRVHLEGLPPAEVQARLYGPGEVTGLDSRQVTRMEPAPGTATAEPHFFAFAEFQRPDLPWLFTPGAPDAQGRLQPWLTLAVIPEPLAKLETGKGPLPVLTCPLAELPDLADAWAWAHAQVALEAGESPGDVLEDHPERALSRIVAPRRMLPRRRYVACLVPTF